MKRGRIAILFVFGMTAMTSAQPDDSRQLQTKKVLARCIDSMGKLNRLQNVKVLSYQSRSHTFLRSISVSDSLPGLFAYETKEVVLQPQRQILVDKSHWQWTESATPSDSELVISPKADS
jgi:hypothetical protein